MTIKSKVLAVILSTVIVLSLLPLGVFGAEIIESGNCGENVTWTLDSDGLLTISGTGEMSSHPYPKDSVVSVVIGNGVTSIGDYAFSGCSGLTSVTIPDGVTSIGSSAFSGCTGLTSVTITDSVTDIGDDAFSDCSGLTRVTIPDSVTSIGWYAFYGTAYFNDENNWTDGVLYIGKYLINAKTDIKGGYTVKDGTRLIADRAFYKCSALTSVTIPDGVTGIGWHAFDGCSGLTSVTIPDSVTSIGGSAFDGCSGLANVTIPDSVTSIGAWAFRGCSGLTSVTIPDSVTDIGWFAFRGCSGLTSVTIPESVTRIGGQAFAGTAYYNDENNWTDGVLYIGKYLIKAKDNIKGGYTVKDGTRLIADDAFYNCSGLTSVTIPHSVTSIGIESFTNCSGLADVYYTGTEAQWNAITIGSNNDPLTDAAIHFGTVQGNDPVIVGSGTCGENVAWTLDSNGLLTISGTGAINQASYPKDSVVSVVIEDGVTSIGNNAFSGCSALTSVTIGNGVTSIGDWAFYGCSGLASVTIPDSVTSIGWCAFDGCSGLTSVTIPDSVTSIGDSAFSGCSGLTSVTIPDGVTIIRD